MKKIDKFMITSAAFSPSSYRSVFKVERNSLVRMQYDPVIDLCQRSSEVFDLPLPKELINMIIDQLIISYIQGCDFSLAFDLICIDRYTMFRFYGRWFGLDRIYFPSILHRLSNTFELLQKVQDGVIQFPNDEHDHYIALEIPFIGNFNPGYAYNPWNFNGNITLIQIPKPGIFGVEDFRAFVTGPYVTDVIWMNGRNDRGVIYSDFFRLPVIVFVLTDQEGNIIPKRCEMDVHSAFKAFTKLLKMAFGPTTGVFFAVQGHFIFDDQILIEL